MKKEKENVQIMPIQNTLESQIHKVTQEIPFKETSELEGVFQNLDNADLNEEGFSNIDVNTRLKEEEENSMISFDELKALGIMPSNANASTRKKRLSISREGLGRKEKVIIASASRGQELEKRDGILKRLFSPRE